MSVERRCICGRRVFGKSYDDLGEEPMHPCCRFWLVDHDREKCKAFRRRDQQCAACRGQCPACLSSDSARAERARRDAAEEAERRRQANIAAKAKARAEQAKRRQQQRSNKRPVRSPVPPPPRRRFADAVASPKE